jgi:hypothetical protein
MHVVPHLTLSTYYMAPVIMSTYKALLVQPNLSAPPHGAGAVCPEWYRACEHLIRALAFSSIIRA